MEVSRIENLPPPPGVINSIKAGFDTVASHITAILLPLLLNLFLWLGPRLRMDALFNSVKADVITIWQAGGIPTAEIQQKLTTLPDINLFSLLFTVPVGISNLFNSRFLRIMFPNFFAAFLAQSTTQTPLGDPLVLQVNIWNIFGWMLLLILIGWVFGGLYFRSVAWLVTGNKDDQPMSVAHAIIQTILVSIFWGIVIMFIGMPVFFILALILQISPIVANFLVIFLSLISMWVIVPLFFWPHGIFIKRQNVVTSIISSVQMTRFTLPTSSMFVLTVFLLSFGLNFLWNIPPKDSWITLLGIFGHSFVSTALLAGSFIYYRDMNVWLQNTIEKLRPNALTKKI